MICCVVLGVPELSVGQSMAITIQPSDDAFGRFSFSPESRSHIVPETVGGTSLTLTVLRGGGAFGSVSVFWEVTQTDPTGNTEQVTDISPSTGEVIFSDGQRQQQFTLSVRDDLVSELQVKGGDEDVYCCRWLNCWKCL